jgi:hypothetical protein
VDHPGLQRLDERPRRGSQREPAWVPRRALLSHSRRGSVRQFRYDSGDYEGHNFLRAGLRGTVLAYATPELQRRQLWLRESYRVRLECDAPDSVGRLSDCDRLEAI